MAVKTVKEILDSELFRPWRDARAQMEGLQRDVGAALAARGINPDCCRVEKLAGDELCLGTVSAAAAVRIKQILPTLQDILNCRGYSVRSVRVVVMRIPD